ncbi:phosphoribosylglycinamide synthetase [Croceicoccus estronivorus]|uniref:phosphoribosylglycinamide synthetase n=1 Tax=Croceicoccus estronivorus TaxID=1172626 RepID=UPI00082D470E|nr:phosphoribosylglycinamide synthetase [Croceicoccus estronivorus]OCC22470.1 phosphoribosylglycinamide synthetase [Croceicoccus estronivorus]
MQAATLPTMRLLDMDKARLNILFLAKHACAGGIWSPEDGNHAVYHHEMLCTLREIGLQVETANTYAALFERPQTDFVVTLLNRGGFVNSEMLAPLLATRCDVPFLGASPILRGIADDKHACKLIARCHDVPTMDWVAFRRGGIAPNRILHADRLVVKPNASSASWGIAIVDNWQAALRHVSDLHDTGHDAIVEEWAPLYDIAVPVIGGRHGAPWILPPMIYRPEDPHHLRNYEEKRGLAGEIDAFDPLEPVTDPSLTAQLKDLTSRIIPELWPFDYGRLEFRYDPFSGAIRFMEINISCNLWSRKTISRSAATLGVDHTTLVETIVAHSLARQGLISEHSLEFAA